MKIGFLFLLFIAKVCFAYPLVEHTEPDPSAIVANRVNVITGNYVASHIDVIVTGEYPIIMQRSPSRNWQWFCHNSAVMLKRDQSIQVSDSNGTHLSFVPASKQKFILSADSIQTGYCNTSRGEICAKNNITNNYIDVESHFVGFYLHLSDGTVRYYRGIGKDQNQNEHFLLEREKHPNGYFTHYEYYFPLKKSESTVSRLKRYPKTYGLKRVYTTNSTYEHIYSWLSIECTTESFVITTSDSKTITLNLKNLQTEYTDQRVKSLQLAPEGNESITFHHEPDKNICRVIDPTGAYRIFHYTQELRLHKIEHFTKEGNCLKSEVLKWKGHRLYKRELLDQNGSSIKKHIYKYDHFGNIIEEHIFAGDDHTIIEKSYSSDGRLLIAKTCEDHLTTYTYDTRQRQETKTVHNGDNTLVYRTSYDKHDQPYCVSIESPDGYVYAKEPCQNKAGLPAQQKACSMKKSDSIQLYYDSFGNIISLKSSDHTLHLSYTYNHLGQLLTARDEIAKTITTRTWDVHGNLISETLANGATLTYAYDQANNCIELTYPDHSRILYTYKGPYLNTITYLDPSGQPMFSHTCTNDCSTNHESCDPTLDPQATYSYDALGRLTRVTKGGNTYIYTYDALHRCIQCNNISYYYDGQNKIGSSKNEKRILGLNGATLAVIVNDQVYTPPIPTEILDSWNRYHVKQPLPK